MNIRIFKILVLSVFIFTACKSKKHKDLKEGMYANVVTNKGDILLELYAEDMPLTVSNFVALAEGSHTKIGVDSLKGKRYYDGLKFHRVIPNFMIQTGDYTGTGSGNNGYRFADEFPKDAAGELKYKHDKGGVLSMANSGMNTNSSQFFITHKDTPWLDGKHSIFGHVLEGQSVVDSIAQNDVILKLEILRIGEAAKTFNAPEVYEAQLIEAEKREVERLAKLQEIKKAFLDSLGIADAMTTKSGLKMLSLKKGRGKKVTRTREISAVYTLYTGIGTLIQSNEGKEPFKFTMNTRPSIKGWEEGLLSMRKGDKKRLFIPYTLGYGERANGPIPAKSDLVFDVEIVDVTGK